MALKGLRPPNFVEGSVPANAPIYDNHSVEGFNRMHIPKEVIVEYLVKT